MFVNCCDPVVCVFRITVAKAQILFSFFFHYMVTCFFSVLLPTTTGPMKEADKHSGVIGSYVEVTELFITQLYVVLCNVMLLCIVSCYCMFCYVTLL